MELPYATETLVFRLFRIKFLGFLSTYFRAFSSNLGKASGQNWIKMINITAKLGEINDIEHNKGSKNI